MTDHTEHSLRWAGDPVAAAAMGTEQLRQNFLVEGLFKPGRIVLTYSQYDRMIVGGAMPGAKPLALETIKPTGTANFLDRRELVAVNIGGAGTIVADGESFAVGTRDMVYLGRGNKQVNFASNRADNPAKFYLLSAPAHSTHPNRLLRIDEAKRLDVGAAETCNQRSIFQYIHPGADVETCQLVVGLTTFAPGSNWNTMPPHLHDRRSEVYFYFGLGDNDRVFHFMGEPDKARHIVMANEEAVVSPPWSIHMGSGTASYAFIWAMGGENLDYTDMRVLDICQLK